MVWVWRASIACLLIFLVIFCLGQLALPSERRLAEFLLSAAFYFGVSALVLYAISRTQRLLPAVGHSARVGGAWLSSSLRAFGVATKTWLSDGRRAIATAIVFAVVIATWMFRYEQLGYGMQRNRITGNTCDISQSCWFCNGRECNFR